MEEQKHVEIIFFSDSCAPLDPKIPKIKKRKQLDRHCETREFIFGHKLRIQSHGKEARIEIEMQDASNTC
jgi:hypothetical protein